MVSSPSKSCDLDPLPIILLKACLGVLIIHNTDTINPSLCSGLFPVDFKCAHVYPVLKKTSLSIEDQHSYRSISKLNFISNALEKIVANRLRSHISTNDLSNVSQSTYKLFQSRKSFFLKYLNIDNGKVTALTLLGLYTTFDTIGHDILIAQCDTTYLAQH